jgi:hypothetical protein
MPETGNFTRPVACVKRGSNGLFVPPGSLLRRHIFRGSVTPTRFARTRLRQLVSSLAGSCLLATGAVILTAFPQTASGARKLFQKTCRVPQTRGVRTPENVVLSQRKSTALVWARCFLRASHHSAAGRLQLESASPTARLAALWPVGFAGCVEFCCALSAVEINHADLFQQAA